MNAPAPKHPASLARAAEIQLFVTFLVQQMRKAPEVLTALDVDELRQLLEAVDTLRDEAHLQLDICIAQRVAAAGLTS